MSGVATRRMIAGKAAATASTMANRWRDGWVSVRSSS